MLIHGEAGIGKSRLCREFAASIANATKLRGQAFLGDADIAHAILVDTLRAARREPASPVWIAAQHQAIVLGAVVPELLQDNTLAVQFEDDARLFEAMLDVVAAQPTLWIAEDIQWADVASWRFLHYCSRRAASMPLLVVATYRDDEHLPEDAAWTQLAVSGSRESLLEISLQRLSAADTEGMAREVLGPARDDVELRDVMQRSGGTPLLVEELAAVSDPREMRSGSVPDVVRVTARERARKAGESAQGLLELAAVMGHDADLDLLVDLRPDQAIAVDRLVGAGLLQSSADRPGAMVEFRHPLLREAVYADIAWERRRRLHAEAAVALTDHASAQSVERIARHWEMAGRPDEALASIADVIAAARQQGNLGRSTTLGLLALALIERQERLRPRRLEVLVPLIDELRVAGRWNALLPLVREELATAPVNSEWGFHLAAILGLGEMQNLGPGLDTAREILEQRMAAAGDRRSPDIAMMTAAAAMLAWARSELTQARALAERAVSSALHAGALEIELQARSVLAWVDVTIGRPRTEIRAELAELAARARTSGLPSREASALLQIARLTLAEDDIRRAEAAGKASETWFEVGAQLVRAFVLAFAGRWQDLEAALLAIEAWHEAATQARWSAEVARALAQLMQGRVAEATFHVDEMEAVAGWSVSTQPDGSMLRGWIAWEMGDLANAAGPLDRAAAMLAGGRVEPGFAGPWLIALHVDAILRSGRQDALAVLTELSEREDRPDADRYTHASFAAARMRLNPSPEHFDAALEACRAADWPWLEGLVLSWAAELLDDRPAAASAFEVWTRIGYGPGATRMAAFLAPERHAASRRLTAREEEIAALIAEGLTNAQIAERLGISPVTAAHHVSSILDKLGVGSRTQVAVIWSRER